MPIQSKNDMHRKHKDIDLPSTSRRHFLSGAAAVAVAGFAQRSILASPIGESPAFLHIARRAGHEAVIDSYDLGQHPLRPVGSTPVQAFAAQAVHPTLPILYVVRDTALWEHLPRGVVSTYSMQSDATPLKLIAETPMALSATGPKSLSVSACGRILMTSASTGRAWNMFALDEKGLPMGPAITQKQTGPSSAPHSVVFSRRDPIAVGSDPGRSRLTLLAPGIDEIASLGHIEVFDGLAALAPVWTSDGRYIIAAEADATTLTTYEVKRSSGPHQPSSFTRRSKAVAQTPITLLAATANAGAVLTIRNEDFSSVLELWTVRGNGELYLNHFRKFSQRITGVVPYRNRFLLSTARHIASIHALSLNDTGTSEEPSFRQEAQISLAIG